MGRELQLWLAQFEVHVKKPWNAGGTSEAEYSAATQVQASLDRELNQHSGRVSGLLNDGEVLLLSSPSTPLASDLSEVSYAAAYPYAHAGVYYGKREAEAEPWTVGQIAAGAHVAEAIKDGRAHNVGVITNAAIAPVAATHVYSAYPYAHYPVAYYGKREAE